MRDPEDNSDGELVDDSIPEPEWMESVEDGSCSEVDCAARCICPHADIGVALQDAVARPRRARTRSSGPVVALHLSDPLGWAMAHRGMVQYGCERLSSKLRRPTEIEVLLFRDWLTDMLGCVGPSRIVYNWPHVGRRCGGALIVDLADTLHAVAELYEVPVFKAAWQSVRLRILGSHDKSAPYRLDFMDWASWSHHEPPGHVHAAYALAVLQWSQGRFLTGDDGAR